MAPRAKPEDQRPEATPLEFKAMAHPLRLRILRLCLHDSRTNKELADALGKDPATTLYHVRLLVRTSFLVAEEVRRGETGALEKPYRATGKSWHLSVPKPEDELASSLAVHDALREELIAAGPESLLQSSRLGLSLAPEDVDELGGRLHGLIQEYAGRDRALGGEQVGLYIVLHRQP